MYRVFHTERFDKELSKLDGHYLPIVHAFEQRLKNEPLLGKPLSYEFLREKKIDNKRIIYLIYPDLKKILFLITTDKREQQTEIDFIKERFREYRHLAETL